MKKMLILALVLIAVPAMAAVTFDATRTGDQVTVTFENTDANNVRAFALDLVVDGTIISVVNVNEEYTIYPGSIVIEDGAVTDAGSAVADASYPGTLAGEGSSGVTIEMGSLYAAGEDAPAQSGTICVFTVSSEATELTISENVIRGGVVMEDPDQDAGAVLPVTLPLGVVQPICLGDLNGDEVIDAVDISTMIAFLTPAAPLYERPLSEAPSAAYDIDGNTVVDAVDLSALISHLLPYAPLYETTVCIPAQ